HRRIAVGEEEVVAVARVERSGDALERPVHVGEVGVPSTPAIGWPIGRPLTRTARPPSGRCISARIAPSTSAGSGRPRSASRAGQSDEWRPIGIEAKYEATSRRRTYTP